MTQSLWQNRPFMTLYAAQTINLLGDALTWVGLALLAYDLAGNAAGQLLATAFTLRVSAFVLISPWAGLLADRYDRKTILITTHLVRMGLTSLLPFVQQSWQLLAIVFGLNVFNGIFSPTYKATLPLVTGKADYQRAIALSGTTYQFLGVLGPGLAGIVAAFVGVRQVFFLDAITFLIASLFVFSIPGRLNVKVTSSLATPQKVWQEISTGSFCLWRDRPMRYALLLQLVAALAGAQVLVNTVSYVQGALHLGKSEYGWVMGAFGIGATIAAGALGRYATPQNRLKYLALGSLIITLAVLPANLANFGGLIGLWAIAGMGQSIVDLPTQTLIADRVSVELQGRVYGAHFAWSHLWWVIAYPIAGLSQGLYPQQYFAVSGAIGVCSIIMLGIVMRLFPAQNRGQWHEHGHYHCNEHNHSHGLTNHPDKQSIAQHSHYHFHPSEQN
jgi:MFS transporter, NRE family, putaive nickel resistance protein